MFLKLKSILFHLSCSLFIAYNVVSADDIPTMMWNIKGNSLSIKPVSALGHNDKILYDNLKDALHQGSNILVFAVNKLSLEDFSANENSVPLNGTLENVKSFLDSQQHMLLPSVKDPLNYIHKAHCGVQEIVVDNKIDDIVLKAVSKALQRSCVVILHVTDDGIVAKEGQLNSVFMPVFEGSDKSIVGVFTGVKSSWSGPDSDHHIFRNLLATAPSDDHFVNYTGCIIMYTENATISIGKESNNSIVLPFPVDISGSMCSNDSTILQLNFKTSGDLTSVTLKFSFTKRKNAWKTDTTVSMTGKSAIEEELDLEGESITAALDFSYSCGKLTLKSNSTYGVQVVMHGFQIQPYGVKSVFSDSFDCVPWFTIPIWMGVFVSLIFIVIINIGIYALFAVHTMDRFDDPKGKTITVGVTSD